MALRLIANGYRLQWGCDHRAVQPNIQQFMDSELNTDWFTVRCIFEINPPDRLYRG
jgi:hypothetical protein